MSKAVGTALQRIVSCEQKPREGPTEAEFRCSVHLGSFKNSFLGFPQGYKVYCKGRCGSLSSVLNFSPHVWVTHLQGHLWGSKLQDSRYPKPLDPRRSRGSYPTSKKLA